MRKTMFTVLGTMVLMATPAFAQQRTTEGGTTPRGFQQQLGEDQPEGQAPQPAGQQTTRAQTTRQQTTIDQDAEPEVQVQQRQRRQQQAGGQQAVTGPAMRASDIMDLEVRNPQDEELGNVDDLVIDLQTGRIRYVAMSVGGVLGVGGDLYAVPWQAFQLQGAEGDRHLVLNATSQQFENAPGFDNDNWPDMANQRWQTTNDAYYTETGIYTARPRSDARQGTRQNVTDQPGATRQRTDRVRQRTESDVDVEVDAEQNDAVRPETGRQGGARQGQGAAGQGQGAAGQRGTGQNRTSAGQGQGDAGTQQDATELDN